MKNNRESFSVSREIVADDYNEYRQLYPIQKQYGCKKLQGQSEIAL